MAMLRSQHGLLSYLAERLGLSRQAVWQWERIPAERLPEVEQLVGLPRWLMRPDIVPPPLWWSPPVLPPAPPSWVGDLDTSPAEPPPARRRRRRAVAVEPQTEAA